MCAGGLPITCYLFSCVLSSGRVSWWMGLSLTGRIVEHGRQLSATPTCTQLAARVLFSLLFWFAAARSTYLTAAAALAAGGLLRVPAALLLNSAVLPHALLLALSGDLWTRQAVLDSIDAEGRPAEAAAVQAAAPLDDASWTPLAACRTVLQLALVLVSCRLSFAVMCRRTSAAWRTRFATTGHRLVCTLCLARPGAHCLLTHLHRPPAAAVWPARQGCCGRGPLPATLQLPHAGGA